jgi:hypothetical protein
MAPAAPADEPRLRRIFAETAGLPPTTLRHKQGLNVTSWRDQLSRNGSVGSIIEVIDDDDDKGRYHRDQIFPSFCLWFSIHTFTCRLFQRKIREERKEKRKRKKYTSRTCGLGSVVELRMLLRSGAKNFSVTV